MAAVIPLNLLLLRRAFVLRRWLAALFSALPPQLKASAFSIPEGSMNILKYLVLFIVLLSGASIAQERSTYFSLGDWKLGEKHKVLTGENSPFRNISALKEKSHYSATAKTIFSEDTPAELFFKRGKLYRLEISLYQGKDYEAALAAAKSIISKFENEYGGAFLEGYTTSEGLTPETFDQVIGQLLEKSNAAMSEINAESSDGDDAYFNLFVSLSTEYKSKNNFLYGKFSYLGDRELYTVTVYEDRMFNSDHVEPAMIHIGSKEDTKK